jgi:hypothetical protein
MPYFVIPGDPDPSKEVAAEILRRHRHDEKTHKEPWLASLLSSLLHKLFRSTPPNPEPPKWPLTGVRQPLGRGPRPRSGAVALKEPW